MILTKEVEIKIGNKNKKHYRDLNYKFDNKDKTLKVSVDDLLPTTIVDVLVECDFCKQIVNTTYKNYHYNFYYLELNKFSCCAKCTNEKMKINTFKKWGVEFGNQRQDVKDYTKCYCMDMQDALELIYIFRL